jgi:hypothetical protein
MMQCHQTSSRVPPCTYCQWEEFSDFAKKPESKLMLLSVMTLLTVKTLDLLLFHCSIDLNGCKETCANVNSRVCSCFACQGISVFVLVLWWKVWHFGANLIQEDTSAAVKPMNSIHIHIDSR